jgi:hypothetical protein
MDASFYMVPFLMALVGTGLMVALGVRRQESLRQIVSGALLSAVVALMFLAKLVTRWWIPLSIAWVMLLVKILLRITRPKDN